jgi:protein-tyrosine-phosphatase
MNITKATEFFYQGGIKVIRFIKRRERKKTVLFICTYNSARSQVADGLLNAFHGDHYIAYSAGTEAARVNLYAVEAMAEIGVDISTTHRVRV